MAQYIITLKIEDAFYQEFSEQGTTCDTLLEQLQLDIQDQLDEYDLQRLMSCMVSTESNENMASLAPKKSSEAEQGSQPLLVGCDV